MRDPRTNPISIFGKIMEKNHVGLIALLLIVTACSLWLLGKELPRTLDYLVVAVVSFYFGNINTSNNGNNK